MLIRITKNSEGIEEYFESGQKKGRTQTRDELDRRVHLGGSLGAFTQAAVFTQKNKKWQDHYYHLTASFTVENNELDDQTLTKISEDMLDYYFCDYQKADLLYSCEAHRPIIQSEVNKTTGEVNQRLLHFHLAVSMFDSVTGNQVRMIPYKQGADQAFQSLIAQRYDLIDPASRKREVKQTKKDIIARWHSTKNPVSKQTKVAELRTIFSEALSDVESLPDAIARLKKMDTVSAVKFKQQKSGNHYLQVKTNLDTRNINLRGKGFEPLEALYYNEDELTERQGQGKYKQAEVPRYTDIVNKHKVWWLAEQQKRKPKKAKKIDYPAIEKKYQRKFEPRIKEQKQFYVLYATHIEQELISGYRLFEKNNQRYLFNNELGVKVYDAPNKISAEIPCDAEARVKVVRLMLEMAVAKGWDLNTLQVTGDDLFKQTVAAQIKASPSLKHVVRQSESVTQTKAKLSAVTQAVFQAHEQQAKQTLSKEQIAAIKTELDAHTVLDSAINHLGVIPDFFTVINNKIADSRSKAKPKNVIDFLTKNCNMAFSDALPFLHKLLLQQCEQREQKEVAMGLGVYEGSQRMR